MRHIIDKFFGKIVIFALILGVLGGLGGLLADPDIRDALGELMGVLPFAEPIVNVLCHWMQYEQEIPILSTATVAEDVLKLAVMAVLRPVVGRLFSRLVLRQPAGGEAGMAGFGYRLKELLLSALIMPLIALASFKLISLGMGAVTQQLGTTAAILISVLGIVLFTALAVLLMMKSVPTVTAVLWQVLVTLLGGMMTTYVMDALCLLLYIAIMGGLPSYIMGAIIGIVAWLIVAQLLMDALRYMIVSLSF